MSENHTMISTVYHLKVQDIFEPITSKGFFVEKYTNIEDIFSLFETKNHLWVVDDERTLHLLGIITESDTIQLLAPPITPLQPYDKPTLQSLQYGLPTTVEEIMSKQPITAHPQDTLGQVIIKMKQHKINQLAIIDDTERLLGEISIHRLIKEYTKQQRKTSKNEK